LKRPPNTYSAYVPDLPGCVATGSTREDVEQRIREAIYFHLDGLREDNMPIPEPSAWTGLVEAQG
jgi:predicted RNase H-like HicB family nuclease